MKPILLDLEAFGPYGDPVSIDFEPLADIGLFVISGPTGAGKSTIFDAMCFALYGSLSGVRSKHTDVRSHHADPAAICTVAFVFDAGGERWRVHRRPAQTVLKKRGSGTTTRAAEAHIERWAGGDWEPVVTGVRDVTACCADLVGLTIDQFERVVMLPQGKFAEVLNANTKDRSELLRTLFGSEIYERAADLLLEQVREAEQSLGGVNDQRARFQQRVLDAIGRIDAALDELPPDVAAEITVHSDIDSPTADSSAQLSLLDPVEPAASDTAEPTDTADDSARRLAALRDGPIARLEAIADRRRQAADLATLALERAKLQIDTIQQRAEATRLIEVLEGQRTEMLERRNRAAAARRVAGLSGAVAARRSADEAVSRTDEQLTAAWSAARSSAMELWDRPLPSDAADGGHDLVRTLAADAVAFETELDRIRELADQRQLAERELADLRRRIEQLDAAAAKSAADTEARSEERAELAAEAERLEAQVAEAPMLTQQVHTLERQLDKRTELDRARSALASIDQQRTSIAAAVAQADAEIGRLDTVIEQAAASAVTLGEARATLAAAERRRQNRTELQSATAELDRASRVAEQAQRTADETFAAFVDRTAPRLAAELVDGEPCAVCGSTEHPAPATGDSTTSPSIDAEAVERATSAAAAATAAASKWKATIASLLQAEPDAVDLTDDQIEAARAEAEAAVARAVDAAEQVETLRTAREQLDTGRTQASTELAHLDARSTELSASANAAAGALGEAAGQTATELGNALDLARERVEASEQATQRLQLLHTRRQQLAEADDKAVELSRQHASDRAQAVVRIESLEQRAAVCAAQIADVLGERSLEQLRATVAELRAQLERWQQLSLAAAEASATQLAARSAVDTLISEAGFADEHAAASAALDASSIEQLETAVNRWEHELTVHRTTLANSDAQDLPTEPPDLDLLAAAVVETGAAYRLVDDILRRVEHDGVAAAADLAEVDALDAAHAERLADVDVLQRVANVVRGQNSRRLSLENWVLSVYLHDVVAHANQHLSTMSNGRYRLVVDDTPANQQGQHGLDLSVDDAHTGRVRASASLSGGETFQASLALALGLADVVMLGRAGLRLDALFIDEGFGSLDAESIDQAITVLDSLRSRGSMVGVITHVEAMKTALPVALDVQRRPDLNGSHIRQVA